MFKIGDNAFLIENNRRVVEVTIKNKTRDFCTIQITGSAGAFRVRESRLYKTEEEAKEVLQGKKRIR